MRHEGRRRAVGELDHPERSTVNLSEVSHLIVNSSWNGNDVMGEIEVLPTGEIGEIEVERAAPSPDEDTRRERATELVKVIGDPSDLRDIANGDIEPGWTDYLRRIADAAAAYLKGDEHG